MTSCTFAHGPASQKAFTVHESRTPVAVQRAAEREARHAHQRETLARFAGTEAEPFLRALIVTLNGETTTRWWLEDELVRLKTENDRLRAVVLDTLAAESQAAGFEP